MNAAQLSAETQPGWKLNQHSTGVPYYFHPCESYIYVFPPVFGQLESPVLFFKKEFAVNDGNLVPVCWFSDVDFGPSCVKVLKALVSHGGLLCRRRGLETLFPKTGAMFGVMLDLLMDHTSSSNCVLFDVHIFQVGGSTGT